MVAVPLQAFDSADLRDLSAPLESLVRGRRIDPLNAMKAGASPRITLAV